MQLLSPDNNYKPEEADALKKAALSSLTSRRAFTPDFSTITRGNLDLSSYREQGLPYVYGRDNELWRAQSQSKWEQLGNGFRRTGAELTLGTLKGISDIPDVFRALFSEGGLSNLAYDDFRNDVSARLQEMLDAQRERTPIYTEPDEEGFNPFKAAWWANNMASIASGVTMLIPTYGVSKGVSWAARSIGKLAKVNKLNPTQTALLSSLVGATYGNMHESYMESVELGPQLYAQLMDKYQSDGLTSQDADIKAREEVGKQLAQQWRTNAPNIALDMIGLYSLIKPYRTTSNLISKNLKGSLIKEVLPESAQEIVNQYSSSRAQANVDLITGKRSDNLSLREFLSDPATATAAFFGGLGGGVFVGGGNFFNQVLENASNKDVGLFSGVGRATFTGYTNKEFKLREQQQKILKRFTDNKAKYEELKNVAELTGNQELYEEAQNLTTVDQAIDHMDNGTFGKYLEYLESVEGILEGLTNTKTDEDGNPIDTSGAAELATKLTDVKNKLTKARLIYERGATKYNLRPGTAQIRLYTKYQFKRDLLEQQIADLKSKVSATYSEDEYGILRAKSNRYKINELQKEIELLESEKMPNEGPYEVIPLTAKEKEARAAKIKELEKQILSLDVKEDSAAQELSLASLSLQRQKYKDKVRDIIDGTYEKELTRILEEYFEAQQVEDEKEKISKTNYFFYKYSSLDILADLQGKMELDDLSIKDGLLVTVEQIKQDHLLSDVIAKKTGVDLLEALDKGEIDGLLQKLIGKVVQPEFKTKALNTLQLLRKDAEKVDIAEFREQAIRDLKGSIDASITPDNMGANEFLEDDYIRIDETAQKLKERKINKLTSTIKKLENAPTRSTKSLQAAYDNHFKDEYDSFMRFIENFLEDKETLLRDELQDVQEFISNLKVAVNDATLPEEVREAIKKLDLNKLQKLLDDSYIELTNRLQDEDNLQSVAFNTWLISFASPISNILGIEVTNLKEFEDALRSIKNNPEVKAKLDQVIKLIAEDLYKTVFAIDFKGKKYSYQSKLTLEQFIANPKRFIKQLALYNNFIKGAKNREYEISGNVSDINEIEGKTLTSEEKEALFMLENYAKLRDLIDTKFGDPLFNIASFYKEEQFKPFKEQLTAILEGAAWYQGGRRVAFLSGVAGAGKSKVVVKGIIKALGIKDDEVATLGDTAKIDEIIKKGLLGTDEGAKSIDSYTKEELLKYLEGKKILVIDEAPRLTGSKVKFLNEVLKDTNIKILLTGDPHQFKYSSFPAILLPAQDNPVFDDLHYLPYLTTSLRVNNSQLSDFQRIFQAAGTKNAFENKEFLHLHNLEHTRGVSVSRDFGKFISIAAQAKAKNINYVIITTKNNFDKYIKQGIPEDRLTTVEDSQGLDWDSVFIDLPYEREISGYLTANSLMYTATSRAKNYINVLTDNINRVESDFGKPELNESVTEKVAQEKIKAGKEFFETYIDAQRSLYGQSIEKKESKEEKAKKPDENGDVEVEVTTDPDNANDSNKTRVVGDTTKKEVAENNSPIVFAEQLARDKDEILRIHKEASEASAKDLKDDFYNKLKDCNK